MKKVKANFLIVFLLILFANYSKGQTIDEIQTDGSRKNNILTAVPFLLIMPQARLGAMGNAGVAVDADVNSAIINMASMAYLPTNSYGFSFSYTPWLKSLVPDMSLSYLGAYYRINEKNTLAASLRYFSIGDVKFSGDNGQKLGMFRPSEWTTDLSYARNLGPDFSMGGSIRFIYSNLNSGFFDSGQALSAGKAVAVDVSAIYKKNGFLLASPTIWSFGVNLSNIGTKIDYRVNSKSYFLPANLKIGSAATLLGQDSRLIIALDLNKLLVPTQPIYDENGKIIAGKDPYRSVPAGIFGSFNDAPGGFSEELKEIGISTGLEFTFKEKISFRIGYNYQNPEKGNGNYITVGAGVKLKVFSFDFGYLMSSVNNNPMANTLRFGIQANFANKRFIETNPAVP